MKLQILTAPDECKIFTPAPLAEAMAGALPNRTGDRWLEPCVGRGAFLTAMAKRGIATNQVTAVELDRHRGLKKWCSEYHCGVDFLGWSRNTANRFDRVIGNPPFVPLHKIPPTIRKSALRISRPGGGLVPPKANCWYAFVCAALQLLKPGGGMCLILPSGWDYADYAADLRLHISSSFRRVDVIRSDSTFFRGILDGCIVVTAEGYGEKRELHRRFDVATVDEVIAQLNVKPLRTGRVDKPKPHTLPSISRNRRSLVRFGDIARVSIGAVTGDSSYFLLSESERVRAGLPLTAVKPVLSRARHLTSAIANVELWSRLKSANERVWLFWPRVRRGPRPQAVTAYLHEGETASLPDRQKIRIRDPWFQTRIPAHADGFLSGMSPFGPWISLNRMRQLTVTNTLYTIHFRKRMPLCERTAWAIALMSAEVAAQYEVVGRRYADGLLKFEPKDVMSLMVPTPVFSSDETIPKYRQIVETLISGNVPNARLMASSIIH